MREIFLMSMEWRSILSYFSSSEDMVTKWMKKILNWVRNGYPQLNFICKQWGNGNQMRENKSFLSQGMEIHKHFTVAISDNMASKWEKDFFYWVWEWRSILSYFSSSEDMVTKWMKKILNWVREWIPTTKFHMQTVGKWQPDERK